MQTYGLLFVIAIGCFGLALICFSLISGDQDPMKAHAPEEPRLYEGATPQFDVEVEPGEPISTIRQPARPTSPKTNLTCTCSTPSTMWTKGTCG